MNDLFMDLLGVPFKLHGRDKQGFDCYGLVLEIENRLGHKMVDLNRQYKENNEKDLNDNVFNIIKGSGLKKTNDPKLGDVVLFYDTKGRVCHIGVLLNNKDFIHCDMEGVRVSNLSSYFRKGEMYKWQK